MDNLIPPKTGFAGFKENFKEDLISGLSVSLIALPLCLGIAMASGVPPMAGFVTAIIGGMVASRFGGTFVTISGPAAGLIVVTLGAVEGLSDGNPGSGYPYALAAIVLGGAIMAVFGLLKFGKFGDFFPSAAVHGMLAAIGIIILVKQLYVAIGAPVHSGEIIELIINIPDAFEYLNYKIFYLGMISIIILIVHPMVQNNFIKAIPAPMWAILLTLPWDELFRLIHGEEVVFNQEVVTIGGGIGAVIHLPDHIFGEGALQLPNFSKITYTTFWLSVTSFALVSALESMLSAKAVDSLDVYKRKSNLNKDMFAMGFGSSLSGLIGGLPMISEIVRSSANINNGAKTSWSNFWHGFFILIFVLFGMAIIDLIPISALAAMLVYTGFRLASPKEFKHMYQIGKIEFVVFVVTIVAVLATDLLIGVLVGIALNLIIHLFTKTHYKNVFKAKYHEEIHENETIIHLSDTLIFSNYLSVSKVIQKHQSSSNLILDFDSVTKIDHTVMHHIEGWKRAFSEAGLRMTYANMQHLKPVSEHPLSERKMTKNAVKYVVDRSRLLTDLAQNKDWALDKEFNANLPIWSEFSSLNTGNLKYVAHSVEWTNGNIKFVLADLVVAEDTGFDLLLNKLVLKIYIREFMFPHFKLVKDKAAHRLFSPLDLKEIDLDEYPEFSKKYSLTGKIKLLVRIFFSNERLIKFLENSPNFTIESESTGRGILIYSENKILKEGDLEDIIKFGEELSQILVEEKQNIIFNPDAK